MSDGSHGFSGRFARAMGVLTGPVWLPVYWGCQLAVAFVGVCYYLVVERTLAVVFSRTINRTRVRVRWYTVPFLVVGLPFALAIQVLAGLWTFVVWWHRWLGRWQWGRGGWASVAAAVVFELVAVWVFVGCFYHPLAWKMIGYDRVPWRWYFDVFTGQRAFLQGPEAFGALMLLLAPTLLGGFQAGRRLSAAVFLPRMVLALAAMYSVLLPSDPDWGRRVNAAWLNGSAVLLAVVAAVGLMVLAGRTLTGHSSWRQFVWFSALRLLEKKRIALFSLGAVSLCTAMLLIVVSVMGGFVANIRNATHGLVGDVIVEGYGVSGFGHYEGFLRLLGEDRQLREIVAAATPLVHAAGLVKVTNPDAPDVTPYTNMCEVWGIDVAGKVAATEFGKGLNGYNRTGRLPDLSEAVRPPGRPGAKAYPGLIHGLDMLAHRDADGHYERMVRPYWPCLLSVIPITVRGNMAYGVDPVVKKRFYIVDDSRTGVYDIDYKSVYVGFKELQRLLSMHEQALEGGGTIPARVHQIQIKLREGVELNRGANAIWNAWLVYSVGFEDDLLGRVTVETWEQYNKKYIAAVETEKQLMMILFGIISIVTVFMVLCVFYMIVVEKTRDIGILKSIGASSGQIAFIFLAYAGVIGAIGSGLGTLLGWRFVLRINDIHDWIVRVFGWRVWNREVYVFDLIPDTVRTEDAVNIIVVATLASIVGAIIPAVRAARMNPVEALRYE